MTTHRHDRSALILFGSETGNSEDAAELLGRLAERLRFHARVASMDSVDINDLLKHTLIIFALSTTGQGDLPLNARTFWKSLLRKRLPPDCLSHVRFTTFGFGDSSYVKFNWAARKLHRRLEQLGAKEFYPRGEADEQHEEGTDGAFLPWSLDLKKWLLDNYPLPGGLQPIPDEEILPPKIVLQLDESHITSTPPPDTVLAPPTQQQPPAMDTPLTDACLQEPYNPSDLPTDELLPPPDFLDIPNGEIVTVRSNTRLTSTSHFQDVRHLVLHSPSELKYQPGDIITIYPKNFPADVDALITLQGWESVADLPLTIVDNPAHSTSTSPTFLPSLLDLSLPTPSPPTLRRLLLHSLDITAIPRRHFFTLSAHFCASPAHRTRLLEFANPAHTDEFFDYTTRPRRSILEILHDFPSIRIPWTFALSLLPRLRGRQYSISSGGALAHPDATNPKLTAIHLTVALVMYRTVLRKLRQGVCSRYIASLRPGTRVVVRLTRGSFDSAALLRRPLLLVAPGTGVAPMRALLHARAAMAVERRARAVLVFGGRKREGDFLYGEEWEGMDVGVVTAFSREQREKVYVQDVIRREAKMVWALLRQGRRGESGERIGDGTEGEAGGDGAVVVCGSSGKMPVAVRRALVDVFCAEGGMEEEEAERMLQGMERRGRYVQETW